MARGSWSQLFAFAHKRQARDKLIRLLKTVIPPGMVERVLVQPESALQIAPCLSVLGKYTVLRKSKLIVNF